METGLHRLTQIDMDWHKLTQTDTDWHRLTQINTDGHRLTQIETYRDLHMNYDVLVQHSDVIFVCWDGLYILLYSKPPNYIGFRGGAFMAGYC